MVGRFLFLLVLSGLFFTVTPSSAADAEMKFELFKDRSGDYRWRLKGPDGALMALSAIGHKRPADAQADLDTIRKSDFAGELKFETFVDESNSYRWRLISERGQTVAISSVGYKGEIEADRAIASLKVGAGKATVIVLK
jgi:uncharacterized protein YegP (UPF0339 family)